MDFLVLITRKQVWIPVGTQKDNTSMTHAIRLYTIVFYPKMIKIQICFPLYSFCVQFVDYHQQSSMLYDGILNYKRRTQQQNKIKSNYIRIYLFFVTEA